MNFFDQRSISKAFVLVGILSVLGLILWNTSLFFERLKKLEREKIEVWAQSQKSFITENKNDYLQLNFLITKSNNNIPIVNLGKGDQVILHSNISEQITEDPYEFKAYINKLKSQNPPIAVKLPNNETQRLYYGDSSTLVKLKYYPFAIVLIIFLLIGITYFFFNTAKIGEKNKLWVGMAKETAHQIGTPLSSLVGWIEILKEENVNSSYLVEMEKDITRLQTITDRFSKIGSKPNLKIVDIVKETKDTYQYLKARTSNLIEFSIESPSKELNVHLNQQLYSWTIENLVKNGIDAVKGCGKLHIGIFEKENTVKIQVTDTGVGLSKSKFKKVFEPGYTSKTRGWGLGLSLAKRIIEDYHNGRIKVKSSAKGAGTTFQISIKKV